jgi:hypothetical protein
MRRLVVASAIVVCGCGGGGGGDPDGGGDDGGGGDANGDGGVTPVVGCDPLPPPTGNRITVTPAQADQLPAIVAGAASGDTIVLDDGTYVLPAIVQMSTPGVTLRSASDDATRVTLDAAYVVPEALQITASNVTIAHVTITRAVDHPIHVTAPSGGPDNTGFVMYGVHLVDGGEQFLKVNPPGTRDAWVDDGRVECSVFQMTAAGRPNVEPNPGGCYTGGIDVHSAWGWVVRQNRFEGIYCENGGLAEHAIHFWVGARDTVVENNVIVNCARAIGFGLGENGNGNTRVYDPDPYPGAGYIGHYDGIIRNNAVWSDIAFYDTGIGLEQARGARVYHNSVLSADSPIFFSSIDYRFANSIVDVRNNLTRRITARDGASGMVTSNAETTDSSIFVDVAGGDFHLTAGATIAIDQGEALADGGIDIDGDPHTNGAPDLGADER